MHGRAPLDTGTSRPEMKTVPLHLLSTLKTDISDVGAKLNAAYFKRM